VDAVLIGTGGADGWPQPGCRCASCMQARSAGQHRAPGQVIVDDRLEFTPDGQCIIHAGTGSPAIAVHQIARVPGGWDVTGPDGARLLLAAGPGEVPEPPAATRPFDIALLDLLTYPAQLGRLRSTGVLQADTAVAALCTDHRVSSEAEMARRCALWGVLPGEDGQRISARGGSGQRSAADLPAATGHSGAVRGRQMRSALRPHRTLIIGGARSGKSTEAELRLSGEPEVTYVAAGPWAQASHAAPDQESSAGPDGQPDTEWAERVARHRARRPAWWRTEESLNIAGLLRRETGAVLIDGLGTWLAGVLDEAGMWHSAKPDPAQLVQDRIAELIAAWRQTRALVVAVTDQVGSGLVPGYPAGRIFRDQLGWLNQRIAAESELNLLVVAGIVITLTGSDEPSLNAASDLERHEMGRRSC
jgi:adenosylcobinamide kinase / adenosylcobinamide-phosphate guanylyltransferase